MVCKQGDLSKYNCKTNFWKEIYIFLLQKITDILKDAAKDEGNVDPYKINPILDLDLMTKMVTGWYA